MKRLLARSIAVLSVVACFCCCGSVRSDPITGITYTYDLSMADPETGLFTTPHASADDTTDLVLLTDGELGDETTLSDPEQGCCLFDNGTYAGFVNNGFGGAPQPRIDVDLHGQYLVHSLTLYYLVEDQTSIYAPQPIPDGSGDNLFDALTVFGSANGGEFSPLGSSNDFRPLFGLDGDFGSGVRERRSATVDLGGTLATDLIIDVRTPFSFIFLGEFVVEGTPVGGVSGDYNQDGTVDAADYTVWRDLLGTVGPLPNEGDGVSPGVVDQADYEFWKSRFGAGGTGAAVATGVPEPTTFCLGMLASLGVVILSRYR